MGSLWAVGISCRHVRSMPFNVEYWLLSCSGLHGKCKFMAIDMQTNPCNRGDEWELGKGLGRATVSTTHLPVSCFAARGGPHPRSAHSLAEQGSAREVHPHHPENSNHHQQHVEVGVQPVRRGRVLSPPAARPGKGSPGDCQPRVPLGCGDGIRNPLSRCNPRGCCRG